MTQYAWVPDFPGTNCEKETRTWIETHLHLEAKQHIQQSPPALVLLPGGFSYGDYLRAGALAARSPDLDIVRNLANQNVPVLGICNGFQILCEAKILPGVLLPNLNKKHIHRKVDVELQLNNNCIWLPQKNTSHFSDKKLELIISCGMGRFYCENTESFDTTLIYSSENTQNSPKSLPGSQNNIAAISNKQGNVLGMMPHPERCSEEFLGGTDGLIFLASLIENINIKKTAPSILVRQNSALQNYINLKNSLSTANKVKVN